MAEYPRTIMELEQRFSSGKPAFNTCLTCGGHPGFLVS
jgi:hypothetical protein